jgi:hypothetical protein
LFGSSENRVRGVVLLSAATYLFAREALFAHGVVYWSHSLFQVAWLTQLILFLHLADSPTEKRIFWKIIGLGLASFIGPLIEWAGYLSGGGIALAFGYLWLRKRNPLHLVCAAIAGGATGAAGLVFLAHISHVVGFRESIDYLLARQATRSAHRFTYLDWAYGVVSSFVALPILGAAAGAYFIRSCLPPRFVVALVVAAIPVLENLVVLDHATEYSFDRLKIILPLLLLVMGLVASAPRRAIVPLIGA